MEPEFKEIYTREDVNDLRQWFAERTLPPTLKIDRGTSSIDLKKTVDVLLDQAELCYKNPNLYGIIFVLERIKCQLIEQENNKKEAI